jgi:hypothetical protein
VFFPVKTHEKYFSVWHGRCIYIGIRKRELRMFNIGDGVFDMQESGLTDIFTVVSVNPDGTVVVDYGDCGYHTVDPQYLELAYTADYDFKIA